MKIDGGCHCGRVTYEAEIDPDKTAICHCTDCQTLSGSAFRTVVFTRVGTFKLPIRRTQDSTSRPERAVPKRPQAFCPECGTPIYSTTVADDPKSHAIRLGTVRQRDQLVPRTQLWFRSAQRWVTEIASIPKIEKQPTFDRAGLM